MVKLRSFAICAALLASLSTPGYAGGIPPLPALISPSAPVPPMASAPSAPTQPKASPPTAVAVTVAPLTAQQKQAAAAAKAQIQVVLDQMDEDFEQKQIADLASHRTADFSMIAAHHVWLKRSEYGSDMHREFATLVSAQRRSVCQMVTLTGDVAHAFVSQHGTITTLDPRTRQRTTTQVDDAFDDTFVMQHGHWLQHLSTTLAEIVIVNGKQVRNS